MARAYRARETMSYRVLVVDDEENIRFALKRWFESSGFEVDVAEDGDVAVALCRAKSYDVVTMDLEMPRMNGKEAFLIISEMQPDLPVIFLTGYYEEMQDPVLSKAANILIKPISLHVLEKEVRAAIERSNGRH